jgi:antitoxin component YwqK of YwqJK toxin-antitoxin module
MKIAKLLFLLFLSYFTFSQKTVNETELTKSESKLFLQQELYSGMVVNRFANNQVKSIYQVNQGLVKGQLIEYWYDSEFKSVNYQDTAELNKLNFQLVTKSNQLEGKIQDSIQANKVSLDYLNYEIGGNEKWIALEIKNKEGKLKSKKKEVFDKYEQLVQGKNSANRILSETRKAIREVNQKIIKETQKPTFKGKKSKELEQVNFIAEGNAIIYDSLGNKFGEGKFIKGLQNGAWVYYFNNGAKMAEVNFLNGDGGNIGSSGIPKNGRDGLFNSFYKNGNPEAINPYKSGKLNGLSTFYYENGKKRTVSNYKAGELDGLYNTYYENGNKNQVSNFKDGKLDGLANLFYENGNKADISNYKAGQLDGQRTQYNDLGLKTSETNYSNGRQNGKMTMYENGLKTFDWQYTNGTLHGPRAAYYENGKIKIKATIDSTYLEAGGLKGDYYHYNEDGSIKFHEFYNKDGSFRTIKAVGNDNFTNAELNKSYKCKCCKATINGLKNGIDSKGSEFDIYAEEACKSNINFGTILGYSNCYDYFRNSVYKYCTLKCARTCY